MISWLVWALDLQSASAATSRITLPQVLLGMEIGFAVGLDHQPEFQVAAHSAAMLVSIRRFSAPFTAGPEMGLTLDARFGTRSGVRLVGGPRAGYVKTDGELDGSGYLSNLAVDAVVLGAFSPDCGPELLLGAAGAAVWVGTAEVDVTAVDGDHRPTDPVTMVLVGLSYPFVRAWIK